MWEAERMHLKHLASNTASMCVLNRVTPVMRHYRKPINIAWLSCSLKTSERELSDCKLFLLVLLLLQLLKPILVVGGFFFLHPSLFPFLPSCLLIFFSSKNRDIRTEETGEVFNRVWNLKDSWDLNIKYKKGGHWKYPNANYWVLQFTFSDPLSCLLIACSGNTEMNLTHELK